jgi:uncharacterized membrane protein YdbT with pleckstrin-like domain
MMVAMGFPKRLLGDDETLVLHLRPHIKVLFWPAVVLLVVAPTAALLAGYVPDGFGQFWLRIAIAVVASIIVIRWTVWPFIVWWNRNYVITTDRLVIRDGVFSRSGHDMPLVRLNDVSFEHSFWERLLGCGTLVVESAGERGQIHLEDIPQVERVQRTLYQLSDDARDGDQPKPEPSRDRDRDPDDEDDRGREDSDASARTLPEVGMTEDLRDELGGGGTRR